VSTVSAIAVKSVPRKLEEPNGDSHHGRIRALGVGATCMPIGSNDCETTGTGQSFRIK
jgi:hypothetical protein